MDKIWRDFLTNINEINDELQKKYLKGFYEYLYGLYLDEKNDTLANGHYETAFGELRLFKVKLAITIIRALAFKMNLFYLLKTLIKNLYSTPAIFFLILILIN